MQTFLGDLLSNAHSSKPEETATTFVKEHELEFLSTWCRVHVGEKDGTVCELHGVDGRVLDGVVDRIADSRGPSKKKCTWLDVAWVEEPSMIKANEFFHEAALSHLVRQHLADIPVFARGLLEEARLTPKSGYGWLAFRRVEGVELETVVNDLDPEEMRSVMLQVFAAICLAQQRIQLKHHDLHLFNVLVSPVKEEDAKTWEVSLPFGTIQVPIVGFHASIIDFGLSSATDPTSKKRFARLDEELLTKPKRDEPSDDWGVWGPELDGDTGYDAAMFVESFVEELFRDRPLNIPKLQIISNLQELFDIDFTDRGRPMETCDVDWPQLFKTLGVVVESK